MLKEFYHHTGLCRVQSANFGAQRTVERQWIGCAAAVAGGWAGDGSVESYTTAQATSISQTDTERVSYPLSPPGTLSCYYSAVKLTVAATAELCKREKP